MSFSIENSLIPNKEYKLPSLNLLLIESICYLFHNNGTSSVSKFMKKKKKKEINVLTPTKITWGSHLRIIALKATVLNKKQCIMTHISHIRSITCVCS